MFYSFVTASVASHTAKKKSEKSLHACGTVNPCLLLEH
jgi:hypothetical protein